MLSHLTIKDFAIIPSLALDFRAGFTAITGETGAGKSILVDALGLLLGARSDSSWVRQGAEKAELTAEFEVQAIPAVSGWLVEQDYASEGQCLLRRIIEASGRSRAWINGKPVTVQQLNELGALLVEIHGQNEHVLLTTPAQQFHLLDSSGSHAGQLADCAEAWRSWKEIQDRFDQMEQQSGLPAKELDYMRFQLQELDAGALTGDALQSLEQEHKMLAQGGALLEAVDLSLDQLDDDGSGCTATIQQVMNRLQPFRKLDASLEEACTLLGEALINCQEAVNSIRHGGERVDLSPERLQTVNDQLSELADLARKHRVKLEDLVTVRDQLRERLEQFEQFDSRRAELQAACKSALASYRKQAVALSACRVKQAKVLSSAVSALMSELGMPGGVLHIQVTHDAEATPSVRGDDRIDIKVSANPGTAPGPLAKVASGGELSRISLAIKVAASEGKSSRTQVFDEVDAGIGGDTANAVGRLLRKLSANAQSLCVTHLAQVAVCADHQLQVRKQSKADLTSVDTSLLGDVERIDEIARMLSGKISDQSRSHAREMLDSVRG